METTDHHILNFSLRQTQALELGIDISETDTLESLENKIAAKLHEGMEHLKDIIEQIDLADCEALL